MRALDRKLLRDVVRLRAQAIAIALVVAAGVAALVAMSGAYTSLSASRSAYYDRSRFPDVFAPLSRAPDAVGRRIAAIPGVLRSETRIADEAMLDVPGLAAPARGRLASIPERGRPVLSDLHLRRGRWPDPARPEALVSEAFALANHIEPGDRLAAIVGGRRQSFTVTGVALSPEYVYAVAAGELWPDDRRFGILWIGRPALAAALDLDGAFNDVAVQLAPGANEQDVIDALDRLLGPYGAVGAYGRDRQTSARFVRDELSQLRVQAVWVPMIFLLVAAFLLNVVLARLIGTQRGEIAALKALGYPDERIGLHYLELMVVIVVAGTAVGLAAGAYLAHVFLDLYERFFRFPVLELGLDARVVALAFTVSVGAGVLGALGAVRSVVRLPAAEALRPPAPARFGGGFLERSGISRLLPRRSRMVARDLERRPLPTLIGALGIGMGIGTLLLSMSMHDAVGLLMDVGFFRAQHQDITVTFRDAIPDRAVRELEHVPGVLRAEGMRVVPLRLRAGHRTEDLALQGLPPGADLQRIVGPDLREGRVPAAGVALPRLVAQRLHLAPGDTVEAQVLEDERPTLQLPVAALHDEMLGLSAYASLAQVRDLLREDRLVTAALLSVDPLQEDRVHRRIKELPQVAGASFRTAAYRTFQEYSAGMQEVGTAILVLFSSIIAVGVIYNAGRIALSERSRELASLRVLGFTRREVSSLFLSQLSVQVVLAVPLGALLGYLGTLLYTALLVSDLYRLPVVVELRTYAFAIGAIVVAAALTALALRRRIDRLDLVAVLKTAE